jgi:transposase-like protein
MARKQDSARRSALKTEIRQILSEDQDLLKVLVTETLQQTLEAEMDETVGAERSERTPTRLGYRSGYYGRTLVKRVGGVSALCVYLVPFVY